MSSPRAIVNADQEHKGRRSGLWLLPWGACGLLLKGHAGSAGGAGRKDAIRDHGRGAT
jgi:hypothetical protein